MFTTFGGLELKRKTIIPQQLRENNLAILMSNYANRAARRIAQVQTFGLKGEKFDALMKGMDVRNPSDAAIMRELQHHVLGQIKYSTELYGNSCLNSPYNCAANVLLCEMIRVGRCTS